MYSLAITELKHRGFISDPMPKQKKKQSRSNFSPEYLEYIKSKHWQARRARIKPKRCGGCGSTERLELNHVCYPPRGAPLQAFIDQPDTDFCWLCHSCHAAVTKSVRQRRKKKQ